MIVQEAGMAVGWPLGLGHDTTGWPLGLRLRLTQEDLQWPREPPLDDSPTDYSTNSSSLDTESTRSFFQDKSMSLGTLIGLPINHYPPAANNNSQAQRRNRRNTLVTSSVSRCAGDNHHHHWRTGKKGRSLGRPSNSGIGSSHNHGSNRPASKTAASAGWALLSVLSCAKVPSVNEVGRSSKSSSSSNPNSNSRGGVGSEQSTSNPPPEIPTTSNSMPPAPAPSTIRFIGRSPAPASKLYDNITFEEEAKDSDESHSSEWNPLFASSSLADDDDDDLEGHQDPEAATEVLEHLRQSLMRSRSSYSDASTQASDWSTSSESSHKRNRKSSSTPSTNRANPQLSQFGKHSAIHMLFSRIVCCRSSPTSAVKS